MLQFHYRWIQSSGHTNSFQSVSRSLCWDSCWEILLIRVIITWRKRSKLCPNPLYWERYNCLFYAVNWTSPLLSLLWKKIRRSDFTGTVGPLNGSHLVCHTNTSGSQHQLAIWWVGSLRMPGNLVGRFFAYVQNVVFLCKFNCYFKPSAHAQRVIALSWSVIHSFCLSVTGGAASEDNRWLQIQSQRCLGGTLQCLIGADSWLQALFSSIGRIWTRFYPAPTTDSIQLRQTGLSTITYSRWKRKGCMGMRLYCYTGPDWKVNYFSNCIVISL